MVQACEKFSKSVSKIRDDLRELDALKQDNKKVVGYGATSKSTTLLMYCDWRGSNRLHL